jgi:hypothetical protein
MPARSRRSPAESLALDAYVKLMRASESVTARAHTVLPADLTFTPFAALEALFPVFFALVISSSLTTVHNFCQRSRK